ncbi:shikimate dehydrogenase [Rhizobium sp. NRK18]|uniref:shikimate dehydrogenase n=1 Tax=Rhizobium sp. NRK18 TaxID=2964667 RepID=UPI0021C39503|nr:shikimate dehydrogenase [Rhizobium sp. NRK18]MCQ2006374.1 shikimate dehydrogenase [Rhizobium sp. NRK18]
MTDGYQALGTPKTVLAGLIGSGIQLSRTPAMHEAEGAAHGLRYVYRLFDTDRMGTTPPPLADLVRAAELSGFAGLNITYPYKIEVIDHLDALSDNAQAIGAVNTVVFRDGKRFGHNTDLWGFGESFTQNFAGSAKDRVLQIGAGGAGVATAFAMMQRGVGHLVICDTSAARAESLASAIAARHGDGSISVITNIADAGAVDGVVNATPVGMAKLPGSPFPLDRLTASMWVSDVIYFPLETELVLAARAKGCKAVGGSDMAVFQAIRAFELFSGVKADPQRMRQTFANLAG